MHIGLIHNRQRVDLNYCALLFWFFVWLLLLCQSHLPYTEGGANSAVVLHLQQTEAGKVQAALFFLLGVIYTSSA